MGYADSLDGSTKAGEELPLFIHYRWPVLLGREARPFESQVAHSISRLPARSDEPTANGKGNYKVTEQAGSLFQPLFTTVTRVLHESLEAHGLQV